MGLLGTGWEDPQSQGIMALAGGLLQGNFGAGVSNMGTVMAGAQDAAMKRKLMQSQVDEHLMQTAQKQQRMNDMQTGLAMLQPGGGLPGGQASAANSAAPGGATTQTPSASVIASWSPEQVLTYERLTGQKVTDVWKAANEGFKRDPGAVYQLPGGGTSFGPPSLDKNMQLLPDGQGGYRTAPVAGSLDTVGQLTRAAEGAKAAFKPIKFFNPVTGRDEFTTEGAVVGGQQPQGPQGGPPPGQPASAPGYANEPQMKATVGGSMGADPAAIQREIRAVQNDLLKPLDANSRTLLQGQLSDLIRQSKQPGVVASPQPVQPSSPPSGNFAAGPSAQEAAAAKANEARLVGTANADVVRDTGDKKQVKGSTEMLSDVARAKELLKQGPTSSGMGELADKTANFFGFNNSGADVAARLDVVAGNLTKNVPRMEGPQSDGDREEYKMQAGRVANRSLPIAQRLAGADEVERLHIKYAGFNGGQAPSAPKASTSAPKASLADIAATAKASGRTTAEVTAAMRAKGYTIGGE